MRNGVTAQLNPAWGYWRVPVEWPDGETTGIWLDAHGVSAQRARNMVERRLPKGAKIAGEVTWAHSEVSRVLDKPPPKTGNPREWPEGEKPVEHLLNALMLLDDVLPYGEDSRKSLRAATERIERAVYLLDPKALHFRGGNPVLALVNANGLRAERVRAGDRGRVMGTGVYAIAYRHADDGADYEHEFERWDEVKLRIVNDKQVLLFSDTADIIGMFVADDH